MKQKIIDSLNKRLNSEISSHNPVKFLMRINVEDYIDSTISVLYLYTRAKKGANKNTIYLVELISAIGHGLRNKMKLKRDSALAAKAGAFILYTFEELGLVQVLMGRGMKGHGSYIVQVMDDDAICNLWENLDPRKIEKLPSETPYAPWTSTRHETGTWLVKTGNRDVLDKITPETHPIIFDCVNKSQTTGWQVNNDIFELYSWALRNKTDAFADIWELQNAEAKATKIREARAIGGIAKRFLGKTFYHLYYYDFRGRKYTATAYLHEQGSDLARGLLLRADKKPIGKDGFFWLLVSIASNWAGDSGREDNIKTDKIPLENRYLWVIDNEEIILSYAESPKVNQGWMKADKPWQFLAACIELKKLREWQFKESDELEPFEDYSYESHLEVYIDGSNNGSQHLSALTKDEVTAPHVNLVPLDMPGDLYKYVGEHVWETLAQRRESLSPEDIKAAEVFVDTLIDFKKKIHETQPRSEQRKELVAQIQSFKDKNSKIIDKAAIIYWMRIKDAKHRRKVVKR